MHDRRHAMERRQGAALGDEAIAAPAEIVGHLGRARQHCGAVLAHRQRRGQVLLDRDLAAELDIARAVGDAEAALAENGDDLVAPDRLSGAQCHVVDLGHFARRRGHGIGHLRRLP